MGIDPTHMGLYSRGILSIGHIYLDEMMDCYGRIVVHSNREAQSESLCEGRGRSPLGRLKAAGLSGKVKKSLRPAQSRRP